MCGRRSVRLLTADSGQICTHILALVYAVQALEENWSSFPKTVANPVRRRQRLNKKHAGALSLIGRTLPVYKWEDVMKTMRSSRFEFMILPRDVQKPSEFTVQNFASGRNDVPGARAPGGRARARGGRARASGRGRGRGRGRGGWSASKSGDARHGSPVVANRHGSPQLDQADRSADDGSGEYNPGVPVSDGRVQPVKMKVFRELADAAARDPNAPRAKRARKAPKKYDE